MNYRRFSMMSGPRAGGVPSNATGPEATGARRGPLLFPGRAPDAVAVRQFFLAAAARRSVDCHVLDPSDPNRFTR
ncbi:hypothetical protein [Salinisphaera orenii]|uniref:hypothetical protein n=1 Tax=Salinisphaera orenii TaxID=856731 RepID=UPI000F4B9021|nr:hypothetical protein [Salinisphaera halophila]